MNPRLRKLTLTAHVTSSVGWLGAVAVFVVLAVVGLNGQDPQDVRGAYLAMELIGWYALVPLSFASLLTGLVQALGSAWGLFRHYWVACKLLINVVATVLLLVHMQVIGHVAGVAAQRTLADGDLVGMRVQLLADAGAALLVLIVAVALSVYKPKGLTRYGWRRQHEPRERQRLTADGDSAVGVAVR
ncbi:hypothetical protein FNH04_17270 [Streptomyces phyllanthi]|uniref:DUF2269 domain-containing protein n=2 Tax=Streptomyces phyllanthi TaxID=1803180 RepID=A0A5N8W3A7_9ACTN|nr:hypothetical protein [Streptomyces phyllanthi]